MLTPVTGLTLMTVFMVISSRPSPGPMVTTSKRFSQAWICSVRSCTMASKDTRCARCVAPQQAAFLVSALCVSDFAVREVTNQHNILRRAANASDVAANKTVANPAQKLHGTASHVLHCMLCSGKAWHSTPLQDIRACLNRLMSTHAGHVQRRWHAAHRGHIGVLCLICALVRQVRVHDELRAVAFDDGGRTVRAEHMRQVRAHLPDGHVRGSAGCRRAQAHNRVAGAALAAPHLLADTCCQARMSCYSITRCRGSHACVVHTRQLLLRQQTAVWTLNGYGAS